MEEWVCGGFCMEGEYLRALAFDPSWLNVFPRVCRKKCPTGWVSTKTWESACSTGTAAPLPTPIANHCWNLRRPPIFQLQNSTGENLCRSPQEDPHCKRPRLLGRRRLSRAPPCRSFLAPPCSNPWQRLS